jgi:uncharacterized alkaline shock family protein YloU
VFKIAVIAAVAAASFAGVQSARLNFTKKALEIAALQHAACVARGVNIDEDKASDAEINSIPDSDLGDAVNPDWLLD